MFLKKLKKIIGLTAGLILVAAWFGYAILENGFLANPRMPTPQLGMTVPHEVKGITVFISDEQQQLLFWLRRIGIISAVISGIVLLIYRGDPFRKSDC
jgi:hypothetical protein